jgi:uncharacterized alkaline shock family protein YloU
MSKIILSEDALASIISNAVLSVEGVAGLFGQNPVMCEFFDSKINVMVDVIAVFGYDLIKLGNEIEEKIKLEAESITPYKIGNCTIRFQDINYEY